MADETSVSLTVGEEDVITKPEEKHKEPEIDLIVRDPNNLHPNFEVRFQDVFGEPDETVFSYDFVWRWAFKLFTGSKLWCYRFISLFCGLPTAIYWGCYFAVLSFCAIWCCEPYMKAYAIELSCIRKIFSTFLDAFYRPCFEACGYIFYNIRVRKE